VMTVCFYVHTSFHIQRHAVNAVEEGDGVTIDIRVVCEPDLGIVTFVVANLISMALSHCFVFWDQRYGYHHHLQLWRDRTRKEFEIQNTMSPDQAPRYKVSGFYASFHRRDVQKWRTGADGHNLHCLAAMYRVTSTFEVAVFSIFLVSLLATLWLIVETVFSVPARFVIGGAIGAVLGPPDNVREVNPIGFADGLVTSTDKYGNALFLAICYWATIIVCPVVTQCLILMLWLCPLKYSHFVRLLKSLLFVQAWNALDVFFVGTISGTLAMETVSEWIIDSTLPGLCGEDGVIEQWIGMGCFEVKGTIARGAWMSGVAALWQWVSIWFTLRTAADIGVHGIEY